MDFIVFIVLSLGILPMNEEARCSETYCCICRVSEQRLHGTESLVRSRGESEIYEADNYLKRR
jgi:hypothetical protein